MSHGPDFSTDWTPYIVMILTIVILIIVAPSVFALDFWTFLVIMILIFAVVYILLLLVLELIFYGPHKTIWYFHRRIKRIFGRKRYHHYPSRSRNHYLIEFRFFGKAKAEMKNLIWEVNKKYHIQPRHRPVPHISLVGPFSTTDERKLIYDFQAICEKQDVMQFNVNGYDTFEDRRVVFIDIKPELRLIGFRNELSKTLGSYCKLQSYDTEKNFNFHATIAMKLYPQKFQQVKEYINEKPKPDFKHILLRVTLIKNQRILCEYDFMLKQMLTRKEALSGTILSKTFNELQRYLEKKNIHTSDEFLPEDTTEEESYHNDTSEFIKEINLNHVLENSSGKTNIFLVSDTHFDHTNIIKYCNRPFQLTSEMNAIMKNNWNTTVGKDDIVFFLGDLVFGRHNQGVSYWFKQLNGTIFFIRGNHEEIPRSISSYDKLIVRYKDKKYLLVHDPKDVPIDWDGWTICGHHHNNRMKEFPFINGQTKKVNVSVELLNYTPVNIDTLFNLDFENIQSMESISSIPIRK